MEISRGLFFSIILSAALFGANGAECKFVGPNEIVSGRFGSDIGDFGFHHQESVDEFPRIFYITEENEIIILDVMNGRAKIYTDNILSRVVKCQIIERDTWNQECNISGDYVTTTEDSKIISNYEDEYRIYNKNGQLIGRFSDITELAKNVNIAQVIDNNRKRIIFKYKSEVYTINNFGIIYDLRNDNLGNYYLLSTPDVNHVFHYRVVKVNKCAKKIGEINFEEDSTTYVRISDDPSIDSLVVYNEEYGSPVIGPDGSVYAWKRTPITYSILKWTWVDSPNDPKGGPDAPANLKVAPATTGLTVTWTASPQDPGCVEGYEVERSSTSGGIFSNITTTSPGVVSYSDASVLPGSSAFYRVRAKSSCGPSEYTAVIGGARP